MKNELCVLTNKYPNPYEPNILVFVQQLVWSLVDNGVKCTVICPLPINLNLKYIKIPYRMQEKTNIGNIVDIHFPKYIGFGQSDFLGYNPAKITTGLFVKSVEKTLSSLPQKPDYLYAHFVTPAGVAASWLGKKHQIPAFMAYGEATMMTIDHYGGPKRIAKELYGLTGIIAVSSANKHRLVDHQVFNSEAIAVIPNGYNPQRFRKLDQAEARRKMGFPADDFLIGFVGSFDQRKGILRLEQASALVEGAKLACAGKGNLLPTKRHCIFSEPVHHNRLPWFYNALDVFALPTLNEGCCNAIVEAMACGLPIISSDLSFNDDILNESNSLRIDPMDVDALALAIQTLRDDKDLRARLAKGSLDKAKGLTLDARARNIMAFILEHSNKGVPDA